MRGVRLTLLRSRVAGPLAAAVVLAGALALSAGWLERLRFATQERMAARQFHVTSSADSGIGTLREAIFAADRADGRARIIMDVSRVLLETPLPALVNPSGVVIDAGRSRARLEARNLATGSVLDIAAPDSVVTGLQIANAAQQAILIRAGGARLTDIVIDDSQAGVYVAEGANDLAIRGSTFRRNEIGVHVSPGSTVRLHDNAFESHRRAAVWSVAPTAHAAGAVGVHIRGNRFQHDFRSVVLINVAARVERNVFRDADAAAAYIYGATADVRSNRMRSGRGFGIHAENVMGGVIADNEIDHNCAGGVMLRRARNTHLVSNRVYANGYGVIVVIGHPTAPNTIADNLIMQQQEDGLYVIGASPILRRNRLLLNRRAGLRLASLIFDGSRAVVPAPLLDANILSGNGADEPQRDEYVSPAADRRPEETADCSWRRTDVVRTTAQAR